MVALLSAAPAHATELQIEGWYRARGRFFDTLSLNRDLATSEGYASYIQHRLLLRPRMLVSDKVGVYADIRALDNVYWGDEPGALYDFASSSEVPVELADGLGPPTLSEDEVEAASAIELWHAWGEVHSPVGTFRFGRMPLDWGVGIWQNGGLRYDAEYGDTADRLQWRMLFGDVWAGLAFDVNSDVILNTGDGTTSYNGDVGFKNEDTTAGLALQYRRTPERSFNLFTVDGAVETKLGVLSIGAEFVGQFGSGDLANGANDVGISGVGAVLDLELDGDPVIIGLEGGLATGDKEPADARIKTFTFDRDYNVALFLFEQPMPTLSSALPTDADNGRDLEHVLLGNAVSNAIYLKPRVGFKVLDPLVAEAALVWAAAAAPPADDRGGRYGIELNGTVRYTPYDMVRVEGTFGVLLPGKYFSAYSDDDFPDGFGSPAFGGQLQAVLSF